MLTLGAEYKDNPWGPTPEHNRAPKPQSDDTKKVHKWRKFHFTNGENDDSLSSLDDLSRVGERDGVLRMVKKHKLLNSTIWPCR